MSTARRAALVGAVIGFVLGIALMGVLAPVILSEHGLTREAAAGVSLGSIFLPFLLAIGGGCCGAALVALWDELP